MNQRQKQNSKQNNTEFSWWPGAKLNWRPWIYTSKWMQPTLSFYKSQWDSISYRRVLGPKFNQRDWPCTDGPWNMFSDPACGLFMCIHSAHPQAHTDPGPTYRRIPKTERWNIKLTSQLKTLQDGGPNGFGGSWTSPQMLCPDLWSPPKTNKKTESCMSKQRALTLIWI